MIQPSDLLAPAVEHMALAEAADAFAASPGAETRARCEERVANLELCLKLTWASEIFLDLGVSFVGHPAALTACIASAAAIVEIFEGRSALLVEARVRASAPDLADRYNAVRWQIVDAATQLLARLRAVEDRMSDEAKKQQPARQTSVLGAKLRAARKHIEESGIPLLDAEELEREIAERRGSRNE